MDSSPSTILLVVLLLSTGFLTSAASKPPHPNPTKAKDSSEPDSVSIITHPIWSQLIRAATAGRLIWHVALILFPDKQSDICRNPDLLNEYLFSWNIYTDIFLLCIFIGAPLRLLAYAQLGKNFTYALAKPTGIVQTGLYRYMQHPGYTGLLMVLAANGFYIWRMDGVAACVLPRWLVKTPGLSEIGGLLWLVLLISLGTIRVREEEAMMRQSFGKEWEDYHRRTKRLVPFVW